MKHRSKGVQLGVVGMTWLVIACGDDGSGGAVAGSGGSVVGGSGGGGSSSGGAATGGGGAATGGGGAAGGEGGTGGAPLLENGAPCNAGAECASDACSDGVCCASVCDSACVSCLAIDTGDVDGECSPVIQGANPGNDCEVAPCATGSCDGEGACEFESPAVECRAAIDACDVAEFCDGSNGACGADAFATAGAVCDEYICDGVSAVCPASCNLDAQCAPDHFCADGSCLLGKRVFVSSTIQNGALGGLLGADALCQNLADSAGLSGQFRAFMSDSTTSAAARLTQAVVPYRRVDGVIVADDWQDLTDGSLDNNISATELGGVISTNVFAWTGTSENGATATNGTTNCQNWQSAANGESGVAGFITDPLWSAWGVGGCNGSRRVYCLQQ